CRLCKGQGMAGMGRILLCGPAICAEHYRPARSYSARITQRCPISIFLLSWNGCSTGSLWRREGSNFLILTAVGEVLGAKWDEIDLPRNLDGAAERMKAGKVHRFYLTLLL